MNSQRQKMKLQQKLSPQQLLLMRLLQLPTTQLEQRIKEEVEKNPLLEIDSEPSDNADANDINDTHEQSDNIGQSDLDDLEDYLDDDDYSYRERLEKDRNIDKHEFELSDGDSYIDSIIRQLELHNLSDREKLICNEIVGSIDASGYLGRDLQLIANDMFFRSNIEVSEEELEDALGIVQSLDPPGTGARNLQECLSLQLHRIINPDSSTLLAIQIVDKYFAALSAKRFDSLINILKTDKKSLTEAIDVIHHLNPKPGWGRGNENQGAQYVIPDFIVSRDGDTLSFALNQMGKPLLRINNDYLDMMKQIERLKTKTPAEKETLSFIKEKSEAAQGLIDALSQRETTLSNIMSAIVQYQYGFFVSGLPSDLRPMRLKDIATLSNYDESTVSRVASQKYVQTEFGTFLLKDLFSKAVAMNAGDAVASDNLKEAIRLLVDNEDKRNPLTDEALTIELRNKGFNISRRTVTKYREAMDIPVGRMRKELK